MRVVGLLGKAELDLALQTVDGRLIHRHENLVGGRFESERVALGAQGLANTIGRLIGVAGDLEIQVVGEQSVKLRAQHKALGQQGTVLLDEGQEVLRRVVLGKHHGLAEQGTHLGTADVEHVGDGRQIRERHV